MALLIAAATLALIAAALPRLTATPPPVSLVAADDPDVRLDAEITAEFGMQNPVVWILEARDGSVWTAAMLERIQAFTREVFTLPGVIALDVVSLASPNLRDLRVTEDSLEPVYLMGEVPQTPEAIEALHRRIDGDPNYRGTLVSIDGRAAMVVANFRPDADQQAVAAAAIALRDRYRDVHVQAFVVGAPVLGTVATAAAPLIVLGALVALSAGLIVLWSTTGLRVTLSALLAVLLAWVWAGAAVVALGAAVLPWTAFAALPTALMAVAVVTAGEVSWRSRVEASVVLAMGFTALGVMAAAPAAAFGVAGAIGSAAGVLAGLLMAPVAQVRGRAAPIATAPRVAVAALLALSSLGVPRLHGSLALFGYGARYLPVAATKDLRALGRHFPPPTALAVRFRGAPGFVESPDVLKAFDGLAGVVRDDPAVAQVVSLADVVKMVHRAFNGNRDAFWRIPDERGLVARYLALAYSPQFRHFVDRAFTRSVLWVYLSSEHPADLARVLATMKTQLAAQPVPGAVVDLIGGDGAVVLVAGGAVRRLAVGALAFVLLVGAGIGVLRSWRAGSAALLSGAATAIIGAGAFGWFGVPLDLVALPCLVAAIAAGAAFGALGHGRGVVPALLVTALLAVVGWYVGANALGIVAAVSLGAPALAATLIPAAPMVVPLTETRMGWTATHRRSGVPPPEGAAV